ncbi:MAG: DNA-binding CsgD family transcriptional regulator [Bacteroidia bacterium]|jgi:DNA-binding CsgD family transcriptional regulator
MPKKALLIYGLVCAAVILVINTAKFTVFAGLLRFEMYIGIAGIVFTLFGIYLGMQWVSFKSKSKSPFELKLQNNSVGLSPRELEVLQHMAGGLTNQEIADRLFVSLPTIKTHTSNIYQKMDVKRRTQAIHQAVESGLIQHHTKD